MDKVNRANQPYFVRDRGLTWNKPLNCIDAIRLHFKLDELMKDVRADRMLYCGHERMAIDLEDMSVLYHRMPEGLADGCQFKLVRGAPG